MFLGDKGKTNQYSNIRRNYDIIIDNERMTIAKLSQNLGFYAVLPVGRSVETEVVYDTEGKLLTGSGLILRKKSSKERTYFSLVRISTLKGVEMREKKSFLGECEANDQPSDFPVQVAEGINEIFNNLFTVNLVDIVKHCTPYIEIVNDANKYRIVSGTGYEAEIAFETWKVTDLRTKRKAVVRNFSMKMEASPNYEREREHILDVIDRKCKELFFVNLNRFEIAEKAVFVPGPELDKDGKPLKKKSKKQIEAELKKKEEEEQV